MKKTKVLSLIILCASYQLHAQDIHFSQYNYSPLTLNPANTGTFSGDIRVSANYKNQWGIVAKPYRTYAISYDMGFLKSQWKKGFLGAGFQIFKDQAGSASMGTTQYNLSLSCVKLMSENTNLCVGLQGGFAQRKLNPGALTWDNQYDGMAFNPGISSGETVGSGLTYMDYSAGVLWNYGKGELYCTANNAMRAHIGLAMFHMSQPNQSFLGKSDHLLAKYVLHTGAFVGLKNTNLSLCPDMMFLIQGQAKELTLGNLFKYNLRDASHYTGNITGQAMYFGVHYRFGDAVILSYMLELDKYQVGLSYDVNVSNFIPATKSLGGIELSLRFINSIDAKAKKTANSNAKFL